MSVDKLVEEIPENLKRFANWNKGEKTYNNASFCTTGCGSFCSSGACTTAYKDISYFNNLAVAKYQKN